MNHDLPLLENILGTCPHVKWFWLGKSNSPHHWLLSMVPYFDLGSLSLMSGTEVREKVLNHIHVVPMWLPSTTAEKNSNIHNCDFELPHTKLLAFVLSERAKRKLLIPVFFSSRCHSFIWDGFFFIVWYDAMFWSRTKTMLTTH